MGRSCTSPCCAPSSRARPSRPLPRPAVPVEAAGAEAVPDVTGRIAQRGALHTTWQDPCLLNAAADLWQCCGSPDHLENSNRDIQLQTQKPAIWKPKSSVLKMGLPDIFLLPREEKYIQARKVSAFHAPIHPYESTVVMMTAAGLLVLRWWW